MARLEAIARGLFYPTPERVVDLIREAVKVTTASGGRLLDICAGEGVAAKLAEGWGLSSYGIELHAERAATCKSKMTAALHGSYHQLRTPKHAFSVLFLNPPYDDGAAQMDDGDRSTRQETLFLRDAVQEDWLAPHGLLVYIPPAHILARRDFTALLGQSFYGVEVFRFPDPEYASFKQVVVLARRRQPMGTYGYYHSSIEEHDPAECPVLGAHNYAKGEDVALPVPPTDAPRFRFDVHGINPYEHAPSEGGGCYRLKQWRTLIGNNDLCTFERPLVAPRPGHIAMLLAAGALNGTELSGGQLVKGSSEKIITETKDEEADTISQRERIVSRLSVLTLATGEIKSWRTDEAPEDTKAWFAEHGAVLAAAVRRDHVPLHDGDFSTLDFSGMTAPGVLAGHTVPTFLDAQKRSAAAIVRCWGEGRKAVVVSGEMGTGKTSIGVMATTLHAFPKVIVVMPTHLVRKWVREANTITKTRGAAMVANRIGDVDAFFDDPTVRYLIMSKERAKLGARWAPATVKRRVRVERQVVDEAAERRAERTRSYSWSGQRHEPIMKTVTTTETVFSCPKCGKLLRDENEQPRTIEWLSKTKRNCRECKEPLWESQAISARGTTRWPLAKYVNMRHSGRFALIIDEVHQYAHASSDQSRAVQLLCTSATHILAMTGTLYGGRASSIFHLLYKVDPRFRDIYDYTDTPRFVHDHGLLETVHKLEEYTSRYGYRRNNSGGRVREIPGVNPAMLNLLLGYTVFLKLADLGHKLPPFEEVVRIVDHDEEVLSAARTMAESVKAILREHPRVLGQYLMACLGYPDCPEHAESIMSVVERWETPVELASAPAFESEMWPKDAAVIDIATDEKAKGLKTLVFFTQTGKRTPIPRVRTHLEAAGLRVAVLDGDVPPDKREEWMAENVESFDVLLTNGRLVETGLDLLFATTIVQYGTEYSIHTLRQSTRRSWRLGQTLPVKVIYLAYRSTMQDVGTALVARKMRAAELVDGDDLGGLAQHDEAGHDFLLELAREAASDKPRTAVAETITSIIAEVTPPATPVRVHYEDRSLALMRAAALDI